MKNPKGVRSYQEKQEREALVRKLIDKGLSQSEIARELNVTSQSVHKFLKVRGWETKYSAQRKEEEKAGAATE